MNCKLNLKSSTAIVLLQTKDYSLQRMCLKKYSGTYLNNSKTAVSTEKLKLKHECMVRVCGVWTSKSKDNQSNKVWYSAEVQTLVFIEDEGTKSISSIFANLWCALHVSQCVSRCRYPVRDTRSTMTLDQCQDVSLTIWQLTHLTFFGTIIFSRRRLSKN